jgi:hypothetical protein
MAMVLEFTRAVSNIKASAHAQKILVKIATADFAYFPWNSNKYKYEGKLISVGEGGKWVGMRC